jgi:hypothetical protein
MKTQPHRRGQREKSTLNWRQQAAFGAKEASTKAKKTRFAGSVANSRQPFHQTWKILSNPS